MTGLPEQLGTVSCDGRLTIAERRAIIEGLRAELDTATPEGRAAEVEIARFLARFHQLDGGSPCSVR